MYTRLLDKSLEPTYNILAKHCGKAESLFTSLNTWLESHGTSAKIAFPYGNNYGWCIAHRLKSKLICNVFAETDSLTLMLRLKNTDFDALYNQVSNYTKNCIDGKYPCGDGAWIHYRVQNLTELNDAKALLSKKLNI